MIKIPLTRGKSAIIDDVDLRLVSNYKWRWTPSGMDSGYAETTVPVGRIGHKKGLRRPRTKLTMHGLLMGTKDVDHKDGNGLNNRRSNLRVATRSQQCQNRKPIKDKKFKGVGFWKGRWRARIKLNGVSLFIGYYPTDLEAAQAYNKAAVELFGEFAKLNDL